VSATWPKAHRDELFALAYRMLGSVGDAEDAVQETFERFARAGIEPENPRAYLRRIATRVCLDRLKSARARSEVHPTSLPEPIAEDNLERSLQLAESLTFAFVRLLSALSPLERAAFLLREVFDHDYADIAATLDRSEAACRQLVKRARTHLGTETTRFHARDEQVREVVMRFEQAVREADVEGLLAVLSPEVTLWADGGPKRVRYGRARALHKPLSGAETVARFLAAVQRQRPGDPIARIARVNGAPGLLTYLEGKLIAVFSFRVVRGRIAELFLIGDPNKLERLAERHPL
jgi:RNA polymerase sigma-70 factor (ECF subfamily)